MELKELVKQYKNWTLSRHQSDQDRDRLLGESLAQFAKVCNSLKDYGEILMALYLCVRYFGSQKGERVFTSLLVKNNSFKEVEPTWYLLFTQSNIFATLCRMQTSVERSQFNVIVLKKALERDFEFMIDELLDGQIPVSNKMIELLLAGERERSLINLLTQTKESKNTRPKYHNMSEKSKYQGIAAIIKKQVTFNLDKPRDLEDLYGMKELHFLNIIGIAMEIDIKTSQVQSLITLMKREIEAGNVPDGAVQLNYESLFRLFARLRKIKLIRFLFNQKFDFEFSVHVFIAALEEDAFDIAVLLHKEFVQLMRENSLKDNRSIVSNCI